MLSSTVASSVVSSVVFCFRSMDSSLGLSYLETATLLLYFQLSKEVSCEKRRGCFGYGNALRLDPRSISLVSEFPHPLMVNKFLSVNLDEFGN